MWRRRRERTVLVRARQPVLRAQRVALRRAEVVDLDDDRLCAFERVPGAVRLGGQLPAGATGGAGASAGTNAKQVLLESVRVSVVVS